MADPRIRFDVTANAEGGGAIDQLATSLEKLDHALDPAAAARAQELGTELARLGAQEAAVARFRELSAASEKAAADLTSADAAVAALRAEIDASGTATTAQAGRLERLGTAASTARTEVAAQTAALEASRGRLAALGLDAEQAAKAEGDFASKTATTRAELAELGKSLQGVNARALVEELQQLGQQQAAVAQLRDLGAATEKARTSLTAAEAAAQAYAQRIAGVEAPTAAQVNTQQRLGFAVDDARAKFTAQAAALEAAGAKLQALGVDTGNLAAAEERLQLAARETLQQVQQLGAQQATLNATTRETEARATALATHLQGLQTGFREASGSADAMGQHLDAAFRTLGIKSVEQVTAEIDRLKAALVAVRSVDPFSADTARAAVVMKEKVQALENELNQVPGSAQRAGAGLTHVGQTSASAALSIEAATLKAVQLGTALLGIGSASQLAGGVLQTAAEFETLRVKLEQLLGSTSAATAAFDQIKQLAIDTPFEVKDLTAAFTQLANFGLKPTQTQMLALADTAAVAGGGTESLQRITLALGQAWAKTKLQGDEILQLTEAGVPVFDLLAKATGKNVVQLQELSKQGALGRDVIIKLFDAIGEKNAGASTRLMATFSGAISNAKDAMAEFFDLIGRSGALDYLTKKLNEALDEFQRLKDTGELEAKAKAISDAVVKFAQGVELAFDAVSKLSRVLELLAAAWAAEKVIAFTTALLGVKTAASVAAVATAELAVAQRAATASSVATTAAVAATGAGAAAASVGVGIFGRALTLLRGGVIGTVVLSLAELAGKFFEARKAAADGDEAVRRMLAGPGTNGAKVAIHDVVSELDDFKKKLPNLQSDIAGLTGEGLAAVAASTIENLRAIKASAVDMGSAITVVSERAAQTLGIELPSQAAKASDGFKGVKAQADLLIGQLPNLGLSAQAASNVVSQALSRMVDAASTQHDFDEISASIKLMADAGRIGPGAVAELLEKVSDRAREVKESVESATPGIQSLGEAAKKAGVDIGELTTGISKSFGDSVKKVADLGAEIEKAGISAQRASPLLLQALDQRITAAKTTEEVALLRAETEKLGASGKLMGGDYTAALDKVKAKAAELTPAMQQLQRDAETLGIKIGTATSQGADKAIAAYERIKASSRASSDDTQAAFIAAANASIKAAGGIVNDWIKVEAATRKAIVTTDEYGNAVVVAAKKAGAQFNALGEQLDATAGSFSKVERSLTATEAALVLSQIALGNYVTQADLTALANTHLADSFDSYATAARNAAVQSVIGSNKYDKAGNALNDDGSLVSMAYGPTIDAPAGTHWDQQAYQRALAAAVNGSTVGGHGFDLPDPNKFFVRDSGVSATPSNLTGGSSTTSGHVVGTTPKVGLIAAPAPAPATAAPAPSVATPSSVTPSTSHTVSISINGSPTTISTASANDSTALVAMLKNLESSARSAGY